MSMLIGRSAVCLAKEVEVRDSGGTAVGVVTELMDVHASLGGRVATRNVIGDDGWRGSGRLLKRHSAGDFGIAPEHGHYNMFC